MIRVGVIGYGYWGPNLVRNFMEAPGSTVVAVSDRQPERLALMRRRYPVVRAVDGPGELFDDPSIDAIAVATPVASHYSLALRALQADKHVLVEKPLAATSQQAVHLIEEAARRRRVLLVDHTFAYTGAVRKIRELLGTESLGELYYYDAVRVNLGLLHHDVNVMWDLAVHDLSIMDFVFPARPVAVSATGISHIPGRPEDVAYITLFFADRKIAHIHVNWLAPLKVRRIFIGGSEKMIVYDDVEPSEKLKIYDKGVILSRGADPKYELYVSYRSGDVWIPKLDTTEALSAEVDHFVECIERGVTPLTGGPAGLRVVQLLEAAERSLQASGRLVELPSLAAPA
jgi:predicted dehydrogenase